MKKYIKNYLLNLSIKGIIKEIISSAILVFVLVNIISYIKAPTPKTEDLDELNLPLIDGTTFNSNECKDRPIIVHFWATWCPTCKLEAPNIQAISQDYCTLTVAVSSGSDADVQRYLDEKKLSFNVYNDTDKKFSSQMSIQAFPTTFIYNSKHKLEFVESGYTSTLGLRARVWWAK